MRMLCTCIYVQILDNLVAKTILGKHTLNHLAKEELGTLSHEVGSGLFALSAGVTGMTQINASGQFVAGKNHFVSIDNDNIVATILIRSERRFVLAAQKLGNFGAQATQHLTLSIYNNPLFLFAGSLFRHRQSLVT